VARPVDERRVGGSPAAPLFMRSTGKEGRKRRRRRVEGRRGETAFSVAIQYTFVTFEWRRAVGIRGAMVINALYGGRPIRADRRKAQHRGDQPVPRVRV